MITVKEDTCEILHSLSAEIIFKNPELGLMDCVNNFLDSVKNYLKQNKQIEQKCQKD